MSTEKLIFLDNRVLVKYIGTDQSQPLEFRTDFNFSIAAVTVGQIQTAVWQILQHHPNKRIHAHYKNIKPTQISIWIKRTDANKIIFSQQASEKVASDLCNLPIRFYTPVSKKFCDPANENKQVQLSLKDKDVSIASKITTSTVSDIPSAQPPREEKAASPTGLSDEPWQRIDLTDDGLAAVADAVNVISRSAKKRAALVSASVLASSMAPITRSPSPVVVSPVANTTPTAVNRGDVSPSAEDGEFVVVPKSAF
jgi:hypothetical protein